MNSLKDIPIVVESGKKYKTITGIVAIKDGVKARPHLTKSLKKPSWLKIIPQHSPQYETLKNLVRTNQLSTVCEEAKCPNIAECWSHGTATIMLMGSVCTRACQFCAVDTGNPKGWLDQEEPLKTAKTVQQMGLQYVVLTSVNRDDLPDGGAVHYATTIQTIKTLSPHTKVEALTPDFQGDEQAIRILLKSQPDVFAQNIETVKRLTHPVRDKRASYEQTLHVLDYAKQYAPTIFTKTSLMLGLGETIEEVLEAMDDLRTIKVDILTLGQYLQPTAHHLPVVKFIEPAVFEQLRQIGLKKGFYEVASGPFVRSSYRADRVFKNAQTHPYSLKDDVTSHSS